MAVHDLIDKSAVLAPAPNAPAYVEGEILDNDDGALTFESAQLDSATMQHRARGHWPDAQPGDPVLIRVLDTDYWAIGWEPA